MAALAGAAADMLWRTALGVIPLALVVAVVCLYRASL